MQTGPEARLGAFANSSRAELRASRPSPVVAHVSTQAEKEAAQVLGISAAAGPLPPPGIPACSSSLFITSNDADTDVPSEY